MAAPKNASPDSAADPKLLKNVETVKEAFWSFFRDSVLLALRDARPISTEDEYREEQLILGRCYRPVIWGVGTFAICFATFRGTGNARFKKFHQEWLRPPKRAPPPPPPGSTIAKKQEWKSYSQRLEQERAATEEAPVRLPFALPMDMFLAIMMGVSAMGLNTKPALLKRDFEALPLVSGKSMIAKHVCPPMTKLYARTDPLVFEKNRKKDDDVPVDDVIDALKVFVENCKERDQRS